MNKKVVIAIPYLTGKGGTETVIKNFSQALNVKDTNKGISWKLISFGGTKYPEWLSGWNKKVYNFTESRYIQLIAYIFLLPFLVAVTLKKEKPDYFIATNPIIWSIAFIEIRLFSMKIKVGAWYHYSFKMKHVKKRYLQKADFFWAISLGIKNELISMGVSSKKIYVIYNPVNISNVSIVKRSKKQNHFIYIGRIDYDGQKNVSELIKAFNQVTGDWNCDFYGSVTPETKSRLLELANQHTKERISFKGFYKNVWDHIKEADVLLLTSKYEGLGMVLIEAAARGISLISSDCPVGPKEVINNNGYLYMPGDVEQLLLLLNQIVSFKILIPSLKQVEESVQKFGYKKYASRIYSSLNLN